MGTVDIVVVNYRTPGDLDGFLGSLWSEYPHDHSANVWVMNNDPTADDERVAERWADNFPNYHWSNNENLFYSGACNRAASMCSGDVVAFFNADTRFLQGTIDKCVSALLENEDWGVVGPFQTGDRGQVTAAGVFVGREGMPRDRGWAKPASDEFRDVRTDAWSVSGSAYFVKRSVWDEIHNCPKYRSLYPDAEGAFMPSKHYYEETAFSFMCRAHGFKVVYYGEAEMIHRWHKASPLNSWVDRQVASSKRMFEELVRVHGDPCG